ncbi:phage tail assembly chaperone [Pseudomonas sp. NFACC45]|uniref:phage tail assembly chaperone n=1 Tax=Pseudomonas sp. NFACC45 TaxID=1566201 RepID=UPI0015A58B05|nr:phage tail assembly chaperone [Pseudomonas sp. NFACC45]
MKTFYSPSTGSIYFQSVHTDMPKDVISIDAETIDKVISNPPLGKVRKHLEDGTPYLEDRVFSMDELAARERSWRDSALSEILWLRERHRDEEEMQVSPTMTAEHYAQLLEYLQSLRNWPQASGFPEEGRRPVSPSWMDDYA